MRRLSTEKRAKIIELLCEDASMRSVSRIMDCSLNTVSKLLVEAGVACRAYQDRTFRDLPCKRLQLDEVWSFIGCKERNVPKEERGQLGKGDIWTWVAICADSKLFVTWLIGGRDADYAMAFVDDVAQRLKHRVQITSDAHGPYLTAVDTAFGGQVDYSQLVKLYGQAPEGQRRYSPPVIVGAKRRRLIGNPDPVHVSTSFIERSNLSIRMMNRRYTRLTNAYSRKLLNHEAAFSLMAMAYNFTRVHSSLRVTPSMQAGVADHIWGYEEIIEMVDAARPKPGPRGPYRKGISE